MLSYKSSGNFTPTGRFLCWRIDLLSVKKSAFFSNLEVSAVRSEKAAGISAQSEKLMSAVSVAVLLLLLVEPVTSEFNEYNIIRLYISSYICLIYTKIIQI